MSGAADGSDNESGDVGGDNDGSDSEANGDSTGSGDTSDSNDESSATTTGVAGQQSNAQAVEADVQGIETGGANDANRGTQVSSLAAVEEAHALGISSASMSAASYGSRAIAEATLGNYGAALGAAAMGLGVSIGMDVGANIGATAFGAIGMTVAGPTGAVIGSLTGMALGAKAGKSVANSVNAQVGDALGAKGRDSSSNGLGNAVGSSSQDGLGGLGESDSENVYDIYNKLIDEYGYVGTVNIIVNYYNEIIREPQEPLAYAKLQRVPNIIGSAHLMKYIRGIV